MSEMKNATYELSIGAGQILEALSSLVETTEEVKSSSSEANERIGSISEALKSVSDISADTRSGMEEEALAMNEIYRAAEDISKAGVKNSESVRNLRALVDRFIVESKEIGEAAPLAGKLGIAVKAKAELLEEGKAGKPS